MRVNVYTEELVAPTGPNGPPAVEIVHADYVSSRTGLPMRNYGVRVFLESSPKLHYIPGRDDDRSAVTFWCGDKEKNIFAFLDMVREVAYSATLNTWREKTEAVQAEADAALSPRYPHLHSIVPGNAETSN